MVRTPADDVHPILPGCEPWSSPGGGPHGVLVLHGFTGSPVSMRPLAEALADAGFAVELPRLPGHGTAVRGHDRDRLGRLAHRGRARPRGAPGPHARRPGRGGRASRWAARSRRRWPRATRAGRHRAHQHAGRRARRDGRGGRGDAGRRHGGHGLHRRRHRRSRRRRGLLRRDAAATAAHDDHGRAGRARRGCRDHATRRSSSRAARTTS